MTHMHWVARQNKLELPNDEEEVNTRDIHKRDGQAHDTDTMTDTLTPKSTRKVEALGKVPPTIVSRRQEDVSTEGTEVKSASVTQTEVYYETRKRELQRRLINEGRCDERLKVKVEESTCLTYTGLNDKTN
jgi:hypothetical protein